MEHKFIKETDAWSTVIFADPIAIPLARLLAKTYIHPNVITLSSIIPLLISINFLAKGNHLSLIFAALFWQFSWIIDCIDGKVAKINNKVTTIGKKLDPLIDMIRKFLAFIFMIVGIYNIKGELWGLIAIGGCIIHYVHHILIHHILYFREKSQKIPKEKRWIARVDDYYMPYDEQFLIFFLFPILGIPLYGIYIATFLYISKSILLITKK